MIDKRYHGKSIWLLSLILFMIAIATTLTVSAENMTIRYYSTDGSTLTTNYSNNNPEVNITLPNTTWNLELTNEEGRFRITFPNINKTYADPTEVYARTLDLGVQTYTATLGNTDAYDYVVLYGYAFNASNVIDKEYTVAMDYSTDFAGGTARSPLIYKCTHDFATGLTNMSNCTALSVFDRTGSVAQANSTGFSSFLVVEDHCHNGVMDFGEAGTDCGGSCAACLGGGGSGGGGGGGGGGSSEPKVIYVTPTPEGATVKVYRGDELVIQYNGNDYHYMITDVGDYSVKMRSVATFIEHEFNLGEFKTIGLTSFFSKEVEVSMYVSNHFATLTFKTVERKPFSFPLLPPRPTQRVEPQPQEGTGTLPPAVTTPRTPPRTAPATAPAQTPQELMAPKSPINIWTIIVSLVFVTFLVGGIALYRAKLRHLEKPPTVTRTGLESHGLPQTSSSAPKPAHSSTETGAASGAADTVDTIAQGVGPSVALPAEIEEVDKPEEEVARVEAPVEEPEHKVEYHIPRAKKLELEKYVFHAYSMGFKPAEVRKALIEKGWPEDLIEDMMSEMDHKDYE